MTCGQRRRHIRLGMCVSGVHLWIDKRGTLFCGSCSMGKRGGRVARLQLIKVLFPGDRIAYLNRDPPWRGRIGFALPFNRWLCKQNSTNCLALPYRIVLVALVSTAVLPYV